jgi:hypothetical protein
MTPPDPYQVYNETYPPAYYPYQSTSVSQVFSPDLRFPTAPYTVRTVPSSTRIYNPRELPIKR